MYSLILSLETRLNELLNSSCNYMCDNDSKQTKRMSMFTKSWNVFGNNMHHPETLGVHVSMFSLLKGRLDSATRCTTGYMYV